MGLSGLIGTGFETNSILIPVNWLAQIALMLYLSILHSQGLPHLLFLRCIGHQYRRNHLCSIPGSEGQYMEKKNTTHSIKICKTTKNTELWHQPPTLRHKMIPCLTSLCCPPVATAFPLLHLFLQMEIVWLYPDPTKAPPEGQGFLRSSTGASGSMRRGPMIAGVVG